jgi:hypothetical protein
MFDAETLGAIFSPGSTSIHGLSLLCILEWRHRCWGKLLSRILSRHHDDGRAVFMFGIHDGRC